MFSLIEKINVFWINLLAIVIGLSNKNLCVGYRNNFQVFMICSSFSESL